MLSAKLKPCLELAKGDVTIQMEQSGNPARGLGRVGDRSFQNVL